MWEVKALKAERSRLLDLINGVFDSRSHARASLSQLVESTYGNAEATIESASDTRIEVERACDARRREMDTYAEKYADILSDPWYEYLSPWMEPHVFSHLRELELLDDAAFEDLSNMLMDLEETRDPDRVIREFKHAHRALFELVPLRRILTGRLADVSTPYGQWLDLSMFRELRIGEPVPKDEENIVPTITGTAVELLARSTSVETAGLDRLFSNARKAAAFVGKTDEESRWERVILHGTDVERAEAAVFLGAMECTYRSGQKHETPPPDSVTTEHILSMASTLQHLLDSRGGISSAGVEFWWDAFTSYVARAEGDFLTPGTLWDCKVKVRKPEGKDLLQVLCYWILGVGSGDPTFDAVDRIGIVNPRLGKAWVARVQDVPRGVVLKAASYIIGYYSGDPRRTRVQARLDRQSLS